MDRSLWLLLRLRITATLRRFGRSLRSLKGALLTIVGALFFAPMIVSMMFAPKIQAGLQHDAIRRYGPLAFLAYCMLNLLLSSGDRAIYYSPAEVSFLFTGPYRPRQLLLYKIVAGLRITNKPAAARRHRPTSRPGVPPWTTRPTGSA